ncbi:MAG: class I SAM-dependent methyltransferase [Desulfurococcales archaeon]|nr:class I SAM-dependent methyltransferase [Desulfurococcales archaeon]
MGMGKGRVIRERYEATYTGYDELYRMEQYEKYLEALGRVEPRGLVLDAGCGTGLLVEYMAMNRMLDRVSGVVCLDYSWGMLSVAKWRLGRLCGGRCGVVLGNVERLPFGDRVFDVVYSFTVLDLVDDVIGAFRELVRVSRGPVVVSMLKRLPYKDLLLASGVRLLGVTSKDVILVWDPGN